MTIKHERRVAGSVMTSRRNDFNTCIAFKLQLILNSWNSGIARFGSLLEYEWNRDLGTCIYIKSTLLIESWLITAFPTWHLIY